MKTLDEMNRDELLEYAKENHIQLYSTVEKKIRNYLKSVEFTKEYQNNKENDSE